LFKGILDKVKNPLEAMKNWTSVGLLIMTLFAFMSNEELRTHKGIIFFSFGTFMSLLTFKYIVCRLCAKKYEVLHWEIFCPLIFTVICCSIQGWHNKWACMSGIFGLGSYLMITFFIEVNGKMADILGIKIWTVEGLGHKK
jgi:hypothetical protein